MDKLAEKADLSVNYVGDLERGVKAPSLDTFIRIVEALDVPADVLIRDSAAPASYVADDELNRKLSRLTPGQKKAATDILNAYIDNIPYIKREVNRLQWVLTKSLSALFLLSGSVPGGYITEP